MKPKSNVLASFFYWLGELSLYPLRYVLNDIIGRWKTVLVAGEYGNASTTSKETLIRIGLFFILIALIGPVILASLLWVVLRWAGDICLWNQPFLLIQGTYTGIGNNTFATWNTAAFLPPPTLVDGVDWNMSRIYQIGLRLKDFHFVCCQEMGSSEARFLANQLSGHFAEFYTYLGKSNAPFLESGLFFASKEPVINVHWYSYTAKNRQFVINRSFAIFELKNYYVVVTHPDSGNAASDVAIRAAEITQLLNTVKTFTDKPFIFCADLNCDRYSNEPGYNALIGVFPDVIREQSKNCKATSCSDLFKYTVPVYPHANPNACPANVTHGPCITDTSILASNRFNDPSNLQCCSIDFFSSNRLNLQLTGSEYHYYLTDHHLMKGEIVVDSK